MNGIQERITFDTNMCRTLRIGQTDLFDCLAEKQYLACGYALPFGYGRFCRHPQRKDFAEGLPGKTPISPPHADTLE